MKTPLLALAALLLSSQLGAAVIPLLLDKEHSQIEVAVKATMDSFTAKLPAYDATLTADPEARRIESAQIKFHFNDVKTGKAKRDVEMHHWQHTEQFPDCVYVMESLKPTSGDTFTATGKFTLHGVTKELTFPVTVRFQPDGSCTLDSEFPLNTQDFGLQVFKKLGMLKVDPLLKIKFHLEGRLAAAS